MDTAAAQEYLTGSLVCQNVIPTDAGEMCTLSFILSWLCTKHEANVR